MVNPSVEKILRHIMYDKFGDSRERTYIIMGRSGPTGKTWLLNELRAHGFTAFEITDDIFELVEYQYTEENYVIRNEFSKHTVIVLNRPICKEDA